MNENFYIENNCIVLTESFLKRRGFCCKSNCRHCPYGFKMKVSYILKTSSDLTFEFQHDEKVFLVQNEIYGEYVKVQDLDDEDLPFKIILDGDDQTHTINYFSKVKQI